MESLVTVSKKHFLQIYYQVSLSKESTCRVMKILNCYFSLRDSVDISGGGVRGGIAGGRGISSDDPLRTNTFILAFTEKAFPTDLRMDGQTDLLIEMRGHI